VPDNELSAEDVRAIILTLMRIEEKLDELFGEDDDDGEEEDLA
jgi:ribosome assembly protein YihI (activator of Der GTPase)